MSVYSKMSKSIGDSNSSSVDFYPMDPNNYPPSPHQQPTTNPFISPSSNNSPLQEEELVAATAGERQQSEQQPQLRRNSSVSSAASRVKKRALSFSAMRRSSSVSERYCRIHDQSVFLADEDHADVDGDGYENVVGSVPDTAKADRGSSRSDQKRKLMSRSRIIRACKKILGL